ncbi:glycosyl transferase, partial [Sesbania bispinosa]
VPPTFVVGLLKRKMKKAIIYNTHMHHTEAKSVKFQIGLAISISAIYRTGE